MKKARLLGLVGVAPVITGFAVPSASAAAVTRNVGKTVSLEHGKKPLINCPPYQHFNYDSKGLFSGFISYSKLCVTNQSGVLYKGQTGLTERVRFYSGGGARESTKWLGGKVSFNGHKTTWHSTPNLYAHQVCQALVLNGNHNSVKYGPVCEYTS